MHLVSLRLATAAFRLAGRLRRRFLDTLGRLALADLRYRNTRLLGLLETGAQRFHEIDDLALTRRLDLGNRNLLALHLLLDLRLDAPAYFINVGGRIVL